MKHKIAICIIYCLCSYNSFSYSDSTVSSKDFKRLVGCWQGSLTYLDYSSNKPFSMPANIVVKEFKKGEPIVCAITYPKEPSANALDTIVISGNGRTLNDEAVKSKRTLGKDSLEIITELNGIDGNDDKAAIIRHTYLIGKNTYSLKKEVQFAGQPAWVLRNEYKFVRTRLCH